MKKYALTYTSYEPQESLYLSISLHGKGFLPCACVCVRLKAVKIVVLVWKDCDTANLFTLGGGIS